MIASDESSLQLIPPVHIRSFGRNAMLIEWSAVVNREILYSVIQWSKEIEKRLDSIILELVPAYNSITVFYESRNIDFHSLQNHIQGIAMDRINSSGKFQKWEIPVCYDLEYALDYRRAEKMSGLSFDDLIQVHSSSSYLVYCIGFLPGFAYLGGLDPRIEVPRLDDPRIRVPEGSVAIAGQQTGVYPITCPGGWNVIGKTSIKFFNPHTNPPCFLQPGDEVSFVPVSKKEMLTQKS